MQNVYASAENKKQLYCVPSGKKDSIFNIDITKTYKTISKIGYFGSTQKDCWFESSQELIEIIPDKLVFILEVSSNGKYVKIADSLSRVYWVHKYCLTLC